MRAAIYCRLSDDRDGTQRKVTEQEADCRDIAARRGWTVAEQHLYVDNDLSAWKRGVRRPGFDGLLDALRDRAVDAVIVWHPDRLMRQPRDLEALLDVAQQRGVQLASAGGGRDLSNPDDVFILRIEVAHACRSSDDTSRRVQRGHRTAAEAGRPGGGGIRPFGYEPDRMTVREDEAAVVREAASRILGGETLLAVAQDFAARGIPTVRGGRWDSTTLRTALLRPRIAGLREHKGVVVGPAAWPALLSEDDWRALRALCDARRVGPARPVSYWLTGVLRCGVCGNRLSGKPGPRAGSRRYVCDPSHNGCGKIARHADRLEQLIDLIVGAWLDVPGRAQQLAQPDTDGDDPRRLQDDQDGERLVELARRWGEGLLSTEEYDAARAPVDARRKQYRASQTGERPAALRALQGPDLRGSWAARTPEQRKTIVRALFAEVRVDSVPTGAPRAVFDPGLVHVRWAGAPTG